MKRRSTSMGRQKVKIRQIESEMAGQVCFSKHRTRLFKKAGELAILCRAEVAAIIFSPDGKPFSFGYPSVEAVLERFALNEAPAGGGGGGGGVGAGKDNRLLAELNQEYAGLRALLKAEKAQKERNVAAMAKACAAASPLVAWLEADVCVLGKEDLMAYDEVLVKLEAAVHASANHVRTMADRACSSNNNQVQPPPGFGFPGPY